MKIISLRFLRVGLVCLLAAASIQAQLVNEWIGVTPVGFSFGSGLQGAVTDAAGVTYITGVGGTSSNSDTVTAAYGPDGTQLWVHVYNGPADWHDQARGITLAPDGFIWVCGNTPGAFDYASVLLLKYDAATGTLVKDVLFSSALFTSEHGASVATDAAGNVTTGGATVGDGPDGLMLGFDAAGSLRWEDQYDGPAFGPYSQDQVKQVQVDGEGDVIAMIYGVMGSNQPDYVVIKYSGATGAKLWSINWGVNGGDYVSDMAIDGGGDVYVTGTGIDLINRYSTIKLDGETGDLIWQAYDSVAIDQYAVAISLDQSGGVYVTGQSDPDGDQSNFNDNFFTIKRDAGTGHLLWEHTYGSSCLGCYDAPGDLVVDSDGNVLLVGTTSSPPYSNDLILFALDGQTGLEIDRGIVGSQPGLIADGTFIMLDAAENIYVAGKFANTQTGQTGMAVFKFGSLTAWLDVGSGLAGAGGLVPGLTGSGELTPGSVNELQLSGALPGSASYLIGGFSRVDVSFLGGVLVPTPDVILSGLPVDASGSHVLSFVWPAGIPAGTPIYVQHWITDPAGPFGFAASNGLRARAN